jgi:hypothetical protein
VTGSSHPNALKAPPQAEADMSAAELLRVWVVGGGLHVSLTRGFDDPAVWGLALVDVARHVARAYAQEGDCTEEEALERIRSLWVAELTSPTDLGETTARS